MRNSHLSGDYSYFQSFSSPLDVEDLRVRWVRQGLRACLVNQAPPDLKDRRAE